MRYIIHTVVGTALFLLVNVIEVRSQWYTITDQGFAEFLQTEYPVLMNGAQLNTGHPEILVITTMEVNGLGYNINSLDGLQYFTAVEELVLQGVYIYMAEFQVPAQLQSLRMSFSSIVSQTMEWPNTIRKIHLEDFSEFIVLTPTLFPNSLEHVYLEDGGSNFIDWSQMTNSLDTLIVENDGHEFLGQVSSWPTGLKHLHLGSDPTVLWPGIIPDLVPTQLEYVHIGFSVGDLGNFPPTLRELWTWGSLTQCLAELPDEMELLALSFSIPSYRINCMADQPADMIIQFPQVDPYALEVCTIFNSFCFGGNTVSGKVFLDIDGDGVFGSDDQPIMNRTVQAQPSNIFTGSSNGGEFQLQVMAGSFDLVAMPGLFDEASVPAPVVSFTSVGNVSSGNDIPMVADQFTSDSGVDITASVARPGFSNEVSILVTNHGNVPIGGDISFTFDPQQQWVMSIPATSPVGNIAQWSMDPLQIGEVRLLEVTLHTPMTLPLGTGLQHTVTIPDLPSDHDPTNNSFVFIDVVVGSYDPNDKLVDPAVLTPEEVLDGATLTYTIRFQNTGTWLAETVRIEDHLPLELDPSTFKYRGSSHPSQWIIDEEGALHILFPEIMLPDSNSNEPESHGFFRFEIDLVPGLLLGDVVENIAAIYFDFNDPIITEPAVFLVDEASSISIMDTNDISIWPNPSTGIVSIQFSGSSGEMEVLDLMGRPVHRQRIISGTTSMDLSSLAMGNYFVRIDSPDGSYRSRFVMK